MSAWRGAYTGVDKRKGRMSCDGLHLFMEMVYI